MDYYRLSFNNGHYGCGENIFIKTNNIINENIFKNILENYYSYFNDDVFIDMIGYKEGCENKDTAKIAYHNLILGQSHWHRISEKEYQKAVDDGEVHFIY